MNVLAISGSLRASSSNKALLEAMGLLAPAGILIHLFAGIAEMPAFNPDMDVEPAPPSVTRFRLALREADAVLISSPEYAHGVPGSLKNALDWVVGSGELSRKPVALVNPSDRGAYAQAALAEILTTMDARIIAQAGVTLKTPVKISRPQDVTGDPALCLLLSRAIRALLD